MSVKLSIITVVYNGVKEIEKTILNILDQGYPNIEYIVMDGGSHDGTTDIIEKYKDRIAHYISEKDSGIYDAMNKATKLVSGDWVNFMHCGDTFYSNNTVQEIFEKDTSRFDIIYGDYVADYLKNGRRLIKATFPQAPHQMVLSHQSVFARTSSLHLFPFDTTLTISADLKFCEQCWHHGLKFHYFPQVISIRSCAGLSDLNRLQAFKETEAVLQLFYNPEQIKKRMQRIKLMHHVKYGVKKIMPSFLQRLFRKNI